jgi:3-methyl-2-oxobutanoate hydroxymethyltransferase
MMAVLTVQDLHEMKRGGKKIAAAVVYEYQMTKICERAGVDVLSVGDSLGRNVLFMRTWTSARWTT